MSELWSAKNVKFVRIAQHVMFIPPIVVFIIDSVAFELQNVIQNYYSDVYFTMVTSVSILDFVPLLNTVLCLYNFG